MYIFTYCVTVIYRYVTMYACLHLKLKYMYIRTVCTYVF